MLRKPWIVVITLFLFPSLFFSQTGPGGVGSSGSNKLWLDANRGVNTSVTSVTSWLDQSGNSFSAVPSSASARPTLALLAANGYPVIDFDGSDDELWIDDNAAFDLTQWHIFMVPYCKLQKDYNAWITKGNDGNENFEMLSYSDGNIHSPIYYSDATRTFPNTASGQITSTVNIIEYSYSSAVGRDIYKNNSSINTDNENKTPSTNNFSVYIGNEKTTSRFLNGGFAEIIIYNAPLNTAQRIIVNNYLAAKYNCTLTANDLYTQDNFVNGNYDHDVAGVGRANSSNVHSDSKGSGIVRILNPSSLDDGDYYLWGHDNGGLGTFGVIDFPSTQGVQGRIQRVWRGSEVGSISDFEIRFDLTGMGPVTASQLRLLIDTDNDGLFADETTAGGGVIGSAVTLGGNVYGFTNITGLNNNIRFSIGTSNIISTPLPVELLGFGALYKNGQVLLNWHTASERNSERFTVERSLNGLSFEPVATLKAAGNKQTESFYSATDLTPYAGTSYYRLAQVDRDGTTAYSELVAVNSTQAAQGLLIHPNPCNGDITLTLSGGGRTQVIISDAMGRDYYSTLLDPGDERQEFACHTGLPPGLYYLRALNGAGTQCQKLIVK